MFPITHIIFAQKVPTSVGIFSSATIRFEISFRLLIFSFYFLYLFAPILLKLKATSVYKTKTDFTNNINITYTFDYIKYLTTLNN